MAVFNSHRTGIVNTHDLGGYKIFLAAVLCMYMEVLFDIPEK